jgi:hypothetical protein
MDQDAARDLEQEVVRHYELYAQALLRYGRSLAPNEDGAKDAVQETFLRYFMEPDMAGKSTIRAPGYTWYCVISFSNGSRRSSNTKGWWKAWTTCLTTKRIRKAGSTARH